MGSAFSRYVGLMARITFHGDDWCSGPVEVASTFRKRWRGLRPLPRGRSLLLPGRSVHGWGMARPLWVVGLDREFEVLAIRLMDPRRMVTAPGAAWMLEMPVTAAPPRMSSRLSIVTMCPDDSFCARPRSATSETCLRD